MPQRLPFAPRKRHYRRPLFARLLHLAGGALLVGGMALLTAPAPHSFASSPQDVVMPLQAANGLQITMSSPLFPAFDPNISDYVVPYTAGSPLRVSVNAPRNTKLSIDGQPFQKLVFTQQVSLTPGQSFSFVVNSLTGSKTYYVRCLPADFPTWTTERPGTPQSDYYIFAPNLFFGGNYRHYVILADNYGVPLWWYKSENAPQDAKLLSNGNFAWTSVPTGEERSLNGSLVHTFAPDTQIGGALDNHELLLLPNGNYVYIADVNKGPVDLSSYGGSTTATVSDQVIEEFAPDGSLVWSWSAMDHISVAETGDTWRNPYVTSASPADPYHMNSIEPDGDGYIISFRHLNALYRVNRESGDIVWKLGGSPRPESLAFVGDTYGNFSGQHDARVLPDQTLIVHDNGSLVGRPPRAMRYRLDLTARTATPVEQVMDADVPGSVCCGSAFKVPGGNWVMEWGGNPVVTELAPDGSRVFRITFTGPYFSYRAFPVSSGTVSRTALRGGMDAQFPR